LIPHGNRPESKKGKSQFSEESNPYGMSTSATNGSNGTKSHASTTGVPTGSTKSSPHQKGKPQKKKGQYKQKTGKGGPMAGNE
jgi:hypothetical protein